MNTRDPVCGMEVEPTEPRGGQANFAGQSYGFCGPTCRERFLLDPVRFVAVIARPGPPHVHRGATYTCPMHPQVVRDAPSCPVCNMALEPRGS